MTRQLALSDLAEFVFHLTRLDSEMFQIARNSGCLTRTFYKSEKEYVGTGLILLLLSLLLLHVCHFIFPS